jgi:TPR repeat protein
MADDYHTLAILLHHNASIPSFQSFEEIFAYQEQLVGEKTDKDYIDYVLSASRKNWLMDGVEYLCRLAGIDDLSFLLGDGAIQYDWSFDEGEEGSPYWTWKALILKTADVEKAISSITALFDWSRSHQNELDGDILFGRFGSKEEVRETIAGAVVTKDLSLDDRVPYADDGDGPGYLYSFLASMRQLMRNTLASNRPLLYMVQTPYPHPDTRQRKRAFEEFNSTPRYFYADGVTIMKGDAVLFDGGRFPGVVKDLIASTGADGKLLPAAVLVADGTPQKFREVGLTAMTGGRFAELELVERNTTDFIRAGVNLLYERANRGDARAQFSLGNLYATGHSVAQDHAQAIAWWRKSADQGYVLAQYHLGRMYSRGQGVTVDPAQAAAWFHKAATQGHAAAQFSLGVAYAWGKGVDKDDVQACKWYEKAARQGFADAQYNLAHHIQEGAGIEQNYALAVEWYRKAAQQGHGWAQCNLADKYEHGLGVQQDYVQALGWYLKSAAQGVAPAMYSLGGMNKNGLGVAPNDQAAAQWWSKAAALGYEDAKKSLEVLTLTLGGNRTP